MVGRSDSRSRASNAQWQLLPCLYLYCQVRHTHTLGVKWHDALALMQNFYTVLIYAMLNVTL